MLMLCVRFSDGSAVYIDPEHMPNDAGWWAVLDHGPPRPCTCCAWQAQRPRERRINMAHAVGADEIVGSWTSG